jgi:UDP-2,3-diacylglucosamine pyrophosphatase LpxH
MNAKYLLAYLSIAQLGIGTVFAQSTSIDQPIRNGVYEVQSGSNVASSSKDFNNDPSIIRFAIMGDRTGGMLPGVFQRGVEKVNLMQPEFVISVGDLIDGYTTDPNVWDAQWNEFDGIIDRLGMRFFYVPGNHDISNELLLEEWVKRRGDPYYHFVYKNVLFLVVHTEDGPGVTSGISDEQNVYFERVLAANPDVRWTFIFKHRPLWNYEDKLGFERIESALDGRNYTLFSGHHHHYFHTRHNSMKHYILGTTGGGSDLRGWQFGEFEHITWVTLPVEGEPVVANLELDGIHDESIVNETNYSLVQALRLGQWAQIPAVMTEHRLTKHVDVPVTIKNTEVSPLNITSDFGSIESVRLVPEEISLVVPPNRDTTITVRLEHIEELDLHELNESDLSLKFQATYETESGDLSLPTSKRLIFDWKHNLFKSTSVHRVDGYLDEWDEGMFTTVKNPVYMHEDWDWRGQNDGWFRFALTESSNYLHIAIEAFDDRYIGSNSSALVAHQDQFFIHLDVTGNSRNPSIPDRLYGSDWVDASYFLQLRVAPGQSQGEALIASNMPDVQVMSSARRVESDGSIIAEIAIPLSYLNREPAQSNTFRFNIGWMDHDRPENTKPSMLWWRPVWGKSVDFEGSATFSRQH